MASFEKQVAGVIPSMMSLALVGQSAKAVDDSLKGKGKKGDMFKSSMNVLVGVPLIGAVSSSVSKL